MDPFDIEGSAVISFSGGRTSAYLLRRILDVGLRPDVRVVFADTGREFPATYDFVREVEAQWGVRVHWVHRTGYFTGLIAQKRYLPNPVARFCTEDLKVKPIARFMAAEGYPVFTSVMG